jgi:hypothetical protein
MRGALSCRGGTRGNYGPPGFSMWPGEAHDNAFIPALGGNAPTTVARAGPPSRLSPAVDLPYPHPM